MFLKKYRPEAVGADFKVVQIANGGNNQNDPGTEVKPGLRAPLYPD